MDDISAKNTIAKNIAYYRKRSGYTQFELSEKLNYSDKSVSKWERGDGMPDVLVLMRMAEVTNNIDKTIRLTYKIICFFITLSLVAYVEERERSGARMCADYRAYVVNIQFLGRELFFYHFRKEVCVLDTVAV